MAVAERACVFGLVAVLALMACRSRVPSDAEVEALGAAISEAISNGNYARALDLQKSARIPHDDEWRWAIAITQLEWIGDDRAVARAPFQLPEVMAEIRSLAGRGMPQAASVLREGYQWGRFGLPQSPALEHCWSRVESAEAQPPQCEQLERDTIGASMRPSTEESP
ncbi:MAG: hypothetical protein FJ091_21815 [Deltaproteobacteria bacterium]|nr:hypothetical protein [Deltaproteobacteria bacterium]